MSIFGGYSASEGIQYALTKWNDIKQEKTNHTRTEKTDRNQDFSFRAERDISILQSP